MKSFILFIAIMIMPFISCSSGDGGDRDIQSLLLIGLIETKNKISETDGPVKVPYIMPSDIPNVVINENGAVCNSLAMTPFLICCERNEESCCLAEIVDGNPVCMDE